MKRREFLKVMGWSGVGATALAGCDVPTTVTLKEGDEDVVSYLMPEEYVIPGVGVTYASTCQQCSAGCGLHGRVREGRVLKLEGNPESSTNLGRICQMGQAGLQAHYNPDRIKKPRLRKGDSLQEVSWDEALSALEEKTGVKAGRAAWLTGSVSGHQRTLIEAHLASMNSDSHFVHETIHNAVWRAVSKDMLGDANPRIRIDKAKMVLSFGADFLGTWESPVHFATQYSTFRDAPRGVLVQIEPKMTLTGGNADLWVANPPGSEGVLALGVANVLVNKLGHDVSNLPSSIKDLISGYSIDAVKAKTGVPGETLIRIAELLHERAPSLVLAGASAEGHEHGYDSVAAIMLLNIILGNVGKTIESASFPHMDLAAKSGSTKGITDLAQAAEAQKLDVLFIAGSNPVYSAPGFVGIKEKLAAVPFKVVLTQFEDETSQIADLVLPLASAIEDWGTHVPSDHAGKAALVSIQQPMMEPLYPDTRSLGDILLSLLKMRDADTYGEFDDYYAFLRKAFSSLPASVKNGAGDDEFWANALQKGGLTFGLRTGSLTSNAVEVNLPDNTDDQQYPYHLVPSARLGLWDGRHANIPWLQEAPDQISKVFWDSWIELHPETASKLKVKEGDVVKVSSEQGSIQAMVYIYKGVHPDAIGVPLGQGHEAYGRYAKGRGINPMKILNPVADKSTGEVALFGTRVQIAKAGKRGTLLRFGGSEVQVGRKLVATIPAEKFNRLEG